MSKCALELRRWHKVTVEALVVGDFQGSSELEGYFLQEEDTDVDADPVTSEGIFVYDPTFVLDVSAGHVVRLEGTVAEYSGLTQLTDAIKDLVDGVHAFVNAST